MEHITGPIYLLRGPYFEFPYCHCLLVKDERCCLIDTAMMPRQLQEVKDSVHIDFILSTHGHLDHTHNIASFTEPVYIHPAEDVWLESPQTFMEAFGFSQHGRRDLGQLFMELGGWQQRLPDGHFQPGQVFELGQTRLQVMHLPGHTPGHCGFFFLDQGILFTADIDLTGFGPFYGTAVSDLDDFIASLNFLIELQPEMIIPGHGRGAVRSDVRQRLQEFRDVIFRREDELMARLKRAGQATLSQIVSWKVVYSQYGYPAEHESFYAMMEEYMDINHLNRLVREGKILQDEDIYIVR
ncbi:MAG: MBL fold metallo-hydrolase [Syntrophomonadaceae bacterium]|jgi:hydroxyacylglutathione hydrolase|nr:MBL fold metallo-hydrolase [Syntrophomonadaceae bacterium]